MLKPFTNRPVHQILLIACLGLLTTGFMVPAAGADTGDLGFASSTPCWLYHPIRDGRIGAVGLTSSITAGFDKPVYKARAGAITALADYLGLRLDERRLYSDIKEGKRMFSFSGNPFHIVDQYQAKGVTYAYAVMGASAPALSEIRGGCRNECNPSACQPGWLCEPMDAETAGFLGVSNRATSLPSQYRAAIRNGIAMANSLYGVHVESREQSYLSKSNSLGTMYQRISHSKLQYLRDKASNTLRYILSDACFKNEKLFARIISPDLKPLTTAPPSVWMNNPNVGNRKGAIGSSFRVASGLISDKVELAIKRGIVELARSKKISISQKGAIKKTEYGSYFWKSLTSETDVTLQAVVMGVFLQSNGSDQRVFVWVVEQPN